MEQIQQLIEILKETPEMALWGIGMFLGWRLLTLASWVSALTFTAKLFINRYFDHRKTVHTRTTEQSNQELLIVQANIYFKALDESTYADPIQLVKLFAAMNNGAKVHDRHITDATTILNTHYTNHKK